MTNKYLEKVASNRLSRELLDSSRGMIIENAKRLHPKGPLGSANINMMRNSQHHTKNMVDLAAKESGAPVGKYGIRNGRDAGLANQIGKKFITGGNYLG